MNFSNSIGRRNESLYEGAKGAVVFSSSNEMFSISFGALSFDLSEKDLLLLREVLETYYNDNVDYIYPNQRCIEVTIPFEVKRYMFSVKEIYEFVEMLNQAYLIFDISRMTSEQES